MSSSDISSPSVKADRPTIEQLRQELERLDSLEQPKKGKRKKSGFGRFLGILFLIVFLLAAALIIYLFVTSGYAIYGDSMSPCLNEGDLVLALPHIPPRAGDMVAFRIDDRILIKRVVGCPGESIDVSTDGSVTVNGIALSEPYAILSESNIGDLEYPLTLSDRSYFVLGDNRGNSVDSRNSILGPINEAEILGKVALRVWPLRSFQVYDADFFPDLFLSLRLTVTGLFQ